MPSAEKAAAESVIEELEEESRQTLQLMPGAKAVVKFLHQRDLPTAVVTRNTSKTIEAVTQLLAAQGVDRQPCLNRPSAVSRTLRQNPTRRHFFTLPRLGACRQRRS